jgi:hypothetical protein
MALRLAGASGGAAVCAKAAAVPADQSRAQVKPRPAMRLDADVRFILKAPFIRDLQRQLGCP